MTYYKLKQTDFDGLSKYHTSIGVYNCDNKMTTHCSIFPNPSDGKIEFHFVGNPSQINSIDIFNSQGQTIYSVNHFQSSFDLSANDPGYYFMRIQENSEVTCLKFVLSN